MPNVYITYNEETKQREYYSWNDRKLCFLEDRNEIEKWLRHFAVTGIESLWEENQTLKVSFVDHSVLITNNLHIFQNDLDNQDYYMQKIFFKIKHLLESKELKNKKTRKINRKKSRAMGKRIIAGTLSMSMMLTLAAYFFNQNKTNKNKLNNKQDIVDDALVDYDSADILDESIEFDYIKPNLEEKAKPELALAFDDWTVGEAGKKLEETITYAGDVIAFYAQRYGLSYELCLAQITQERKNGIDGLYNNPCQITYDLFVGRTLIVPVYDVNGFTGNYDTIEITEEMLNTLEGNIMVGLGFDRYCIDKYESLFTGVFSYNQGEYALDLACDYYNVNEEDYKGDDAFLKAQDLIVNYFKERNESRGVTSTHGDPSYIQNIGRYIVFEDGKKEISYYLGNELITIDLTNTNVYNNDLTRGGIS